jgi:hypothetical protein
MSENNDFFYFCEETSKVDPKTFDFVKKPGEAGTWWLEFRADLHFFDVINRNVRGYLCDNVRERVFSPKNKDLMERNAWFGENDHPFQTYENQPLTRKRIEKVVWEKRSHKIQDPVFTPEKLNAKISTCSGTEVGRGFANDIIQGLIPAFSCRSCGELQIINSKPTVIISKLITYDNVPFAGFEGAKQTTPVKAKGSKIMLESGEEKVLDIKIPYKDLLDDLTKDDEKAYAYMESADGDVALEGVTDDGRVHLVNGGLHIYAGLNKQSVGMVRDFYRSFGRK